MIGSTDTTAEESETVYDDLVIGTGMQGRLFALRQHMQELPDALAPRLSIRYESPITRFAAVSGSAVVEIDLPDHEEATPFWHQRADAEVTQHA